METTINRKAPTLNLGHRIGAGQFAFDHIDRSGFFATVMEFANFAFI